MAQCRDSSLATQWMRNQYCVLIGCATYLLDLWMNLEFFETHNPTTTPTPTITLLTLAPTEITSRCPDVVAGQLLQLDAAWPPSQQCRCVHTRCTMPLYILIYMTYWSENRHRNRKKGNRQQSSCDAIWQGCPLCPDQSIKPSQTFLLKLQHICMYVYKYVYLCIIHEYLPLMFRKLLRCRRHVCVLRPKRWSGCDQISIETWCMFALWWSIAGYPGYPDFTSTCGTWWLRWISWSVNQWIRFVSHSPSVGLTWALGAMAKVRVSLFGSHVWSWKLQVIMYWWPLMSLEHVRQECEAICRQAQIRMFVYSKDWVFQRISRILERSRIWQSLSIPGYQNVGRPRLCRSGAWMKLQSQQSLREPERTTACWCSRPSLFMDDISFNTLANSCCVFVTL